MLVDAAPRIRIVRFVGYRVFKDTTLHLHPSMTILVGESGSGKTSALYEIVRVVDGPDLAFSITGAADSATVEATLSSTGSRPPLAYSEVDEPGGNDSRYWTEMKYLWDKAAPSTRAAVSDNATKLVGAQVHVIAHAHYLLFSVGGGPELLLLFQPAGIRHLIRIAVGVTLRSASLDDPCGARVVVLDDLDRDLSPSLQVGLLGKLVETFPGVQWVLSTRSPIIIGEAKADMVRVLDEGLVYYPGFTYGKSTVDVLSTVFGVRDRVEPVRTKILELGRLCMAPDLDAAERALEELTTLLGADDPALAVPRLGLRAKRGAMG